MGSAASGGDRAARFRFDMLRDRDEGSAERSEAVAGDIDTDMAAAAVVALPVPVPVRGASSILGMAMATCTIRWEDRASRRRLVVLPVLPPLLAGWPFNPATGVGDSPQPEALASLASECWCSTRRWSGALLSLSLSLPPPLPSPPPLPVSSSPRWTPAGM